MAVIEKDGLWQYIDESGNIYILYPVTKLDNVSGTGKLVQLENGTTLKTLDGTNVAFITDDALADYAKKSDLDDYAKKSDLESKAPAYTYGTADLTAGSSPLAEGTLYIVYE